MAPSTPAGFLSFPEDILREIPKFLTSKDLKILRLVCTQLNIIIEPNLLSCLLIDESTLKPDISPLEILAAGKTRATLHARKLVIYLFDVFWSVPWEHSEGVDETRSTEDHIKKYLGSALSSLQNLDSLVWLLDGDDPYWTLYTIVDAISHLPHFQDFQLVLSSNMGSSHLRLDRLSGLTKVSLCGMCENYSGLIGKLAIAIARSPHLTHLEIDLDGLNWGFVRGSPSLHHLFAKIPPGTNLKLTHLALHDIPCKFDAFTVPHLRSLVSLDLSRLPKPRSSGIFPALTLEKIHLRHIIIDIMDKALLYYLESYSSVLEQLELNHMTAQESDSLAERFYSSALAKHAGSIQVLKIQPNFEGNWCYGPQMAAGLSQCRKLASLAVVLPSTVRTKPSHSSDPYSFVTSILPKLPRLGEVDLKSVSQGQTYTFTSIADFSLWLGEANPELDRRLISSLCTIRVSRALLPELEII